VCQLVTGLTRSGNRSEGRRDTLLYACPSFGKTPHRRGALNSHRRPPLCTSAAQGARATPARSRWSSVSDGREATHPARADDWTCRRPVPSSARAWIRTLHACGQHNDRQSSAVPIGLAVAHTPADTEARCERVSLGVSRPSRARAREARARTHVERTHVGYRRSATRARSVEPVDALPPDPAPPHRDDVLTDHADDDETTYARPPQVARRAGGRLGP
jgi:hypothetical protein